MKAKSVLYAAVGAPVVAARKVSGGMMDLKDRVSKESASYTEAAEKAIDGWAAEGEKVISNIGEGKVVEEISQKVDLDQAKEQVSKLRDQLEDMLATWRSSFRPEKEADEPTKEPAAEGDEKVTKPASKTSPAKKPAAKKTSAAKTTSPKGGSSAKSGKSSTAAKKSSEKTEAAKAKAS